MPRMPRMHCQAVWIERSTTPTSCAKTLGTVLSTDMQHTNWTCHDMSISLSLSMCNRPQARQQHCAKHSHAYDNAYMVVPCARMVLWHHWLLRHLRWKACCLLRRGDRCELFTSNVVNSDMPGAAAMEAECKACQGEWLEAGSARVAKANFQF